MRVLVLVLLSGCCYVRAQRWSRVDTALATTYVAASLLDWYQTANGGILTRCKEQNPILGPCGERVPLALYIPVGDAAILGLAYLVPDRWRPAVLGLLAGAELDTVYVNHFLAY